MSCIFCE